MQPSKRDLWRAVDAVSTTSDETGIPDLSTHVVTLTEAGEEVDPKPSEDATVLETESDVVTVWRE